MAIVCPNVGEILLLRYIVNIFRDTSDHNVLHLYTNPATPGESSTASSFTEPTVGGYEPLTLGGSLWTVVADDDTNTAVFSDQLFHFTTGVTVYGYFVTDKYGSLLWAEKFDGDGFALPASGGDVTIGPKLTLE